MIKLKPLLTINELADSSVRSLNDLQRYLIQQVQKGTVDNDAARIIYFGAESEAEKGGNEHIAVVNAMRAVSAEMKK